MNLRWTSIALLLILLVTTSTDAQKRKKGDKKKETDAVTSAPKSEGKSEGGRRSGRHTTTLRTTTTTTTAPTTVPIVEEDVDEEIQIVNESRSVRNECPPELRPEGDNSLPCTCRDDMDENALMIECIALTSSQEMHKIFNTLLLGKRIDALEVRNSTLGQLVLRQTAQAYAGTILMRGNQITELTVDAFQGTDQNIGRLDLSSNQISRVNFSMFDIYTQLQVLNLGENQMTSIEDAGQAPSLRVLYLYSNKIDSIAPRAFQRLNALEYLDLRWNNLQVLAPGALYVSSDRWQLRLRANQLSDLEDVFSEENLPYLIDLSLNKISTLTDNVYGPLVEVAFSEGSKLYLAGNPIQCDCSISWLTKNTRLLSTVIGAKCDGDGSGIGDLGSDEFRKCPPSRPWKTPSNKALTELTKEGDTI